MVIYSEGRIINRYAAEPEKSVLHSDDPAVRIFITDFLTQYCRKQDAHPEKTVFFARSEYKQEILFCLASILSASEQTAEMPDYIKDIVSTEDVPPADILVFDASECARGSVLPEILNGINELQGYCGVNIHIAELERSMCDSGVYEQFKEHFFELTGKPWSIARSDFTSGGEDIVYTLKHIGFMEEKDARTYLFRAACGWDTPVTKKEFISRLAERTDRRLICILHSFKEGRTSELADEFGAVCGSLLWPIILS